MADSASARQALLDLADADKYTEPRCEGGRIYFSLALQDGSRQPWQIADTVSNRHFAWWVHACDRPLRARAQEVE